MVGDTTAAEVLPLLEKHGANIISLSYLAAERAARHEARPDQDLRSRLPPAAHRADIAKIPERRRQRPSVPG